MKNSKKILFALVLALFALFVTACSSSKNDAEGSNKSGELSGEIVMWHSFTQGPRLESIQTVSYTHLTLPTILRV